MSEVESSGDADAGDGESGGDGGGDNGGVGNERASAARVAHMVLTCARAERMDATQRNVDFGRRTLSLGSLVTVLVLTLTTYDSHPVSAGIDAT